MLFYNTIIHRTMRFIDWDDAYKMWYHSRFSVKYAYYLLDLVSGACVPFQTEQELKAYWLENGLWDMLNFTGKDTYLDYDGELRLRPYKIVDSSWRTIDIRDWDFSSVDTSCIHQPRNHSAWRFRSGSRNHSHRKHGPAMYRDALRQESYIWDEENSIYRDYIHSQKRKPRISDAWDYIEYAYGKDYICSKCWKDQCKADRQYNKHHPESKPSTRRNTEFLEDFDEGEVFF